MPRSYDNRNYPYEAMKARCYYQKHKSYADYGGRGITICDRWINSIENFKADVGPRPAGTTIGRIDNNGNYEPGNVRWETPKEQAANRRPHRPYECDRSGENNSRATITRQIADIIRVNCDAGVFSQRQIARWFGVKHSLVSDIALRRCWL